MAKITIKHSPNLKRILFIVFNCCVLLFLIGIYFSKDPQPPNNIRGRLLKPKDSISFKSSSLNLTINIQNANPIGGLQKSVKNVESSVCKIPKLDLKNKEVLASYVKPKPLECDKTQHNWVMIDPNGKLQATDYAKDNFGLDEIKCVGSYFYRVDDDHLKWKELGEVSFGYEFNDSDFKMVKCTFENETNSQIFMNVITQEDLIKKTKDTSRPSSWSGLSVYWFSFDSLSQMAFRRLLPKTIKYLEQTLRSVTLNGYNIVGDGTPQAFIPILTGKTELELPLTRKRYKKADYVDVYPWIWKNYSENGYVTAYGEDAAYVGTFTYRLKGFKNQPTDHYTRTFFKVSENFFKGYAYCIGSENSMTVWIRYAKEFMMKYPKNIPKFAVFHHSAFSHDSISDIENLDDEIMEHFKELYENEYFENTVVIVGADHGHRFSALRETQQGQMEERLPMMTIALPQSFKASEKGKIIHENLKTNANRLASPFDLYSTFLDILNLPDDLKTPQNISIRSLSLLRPIPESRTCEQAGIEPHWCTCLQWKDTSPEVGQLLANGVVEAINVYTKPERKLCAELKLDKMIKHTMLVPDEKVLKYSGVSDKDGFVPKFKGKAQRTLATYSLTFTTMPGNARYEVTVQYDLKLRILTVDILAISHINKYGDMPHCIIDKNYFMATYCVCYDKIGSVPDS